LKPEIRQAHDHDEERDTEPKDGKVVTDKEYMNDLSKTAKIQCITTPMGLGNKHIESLPQEVRIYTSQGGEFPEAIQTQKVNYTDGISV